MRYPLTLFIVFAVFALTGCATAIHTDIFPTTRSFVELPPVKSKDVAVFESFDDIGEKNYSIVGQIDIWGRGPNLMDPLLVKRAAKMGADGVLLLVRFEAYPTFHMLPYRASSTYLGSKDNKDYYMDTYKGSSNPDMPYFRYFAYAIRFDSTGAVLDDGSPQLDSERFKVLSEKYSRKLILESNQEDPAVSESELKELLSDLEKAGFSELSEFDHAAVDAKARMLAGPEFANNAEDVQKRLQKLKTIAQIGAVLSYA